jgi:hypothetical protein
LPPAAAAGALEVLVPLELDPESEELVPLEVVLVVAAGLLEVLPSFLVEL